MVVVLGHLLTFVSALQSADSKPRCVVAMAGQFESRAPDRNVSSDTVAAAQFMELGVPVVFVGNKLCWQVPYDPTDLGGIIDARTDHPLTKSGRGSHPSLVELPR